MPSFFEGLKRMLSGQPVFRPGEDVDGRELKQNPQYKPDIPPQQPMQQPVSQHSAEVVTQQSGQQAGPKVIPQAIVERVENRINGQYLDISITIRNNSQGNIMLDKIMLLGMTRELDRHLGPGQEFEFVSVYNGPLLKNRSYTHAEIQYRNDAGDYFSAIHNVEFEQKPDGTYTIYHMRFIPPVKDI